MIGKDKKIYLENGGIVIRCSMCNSYFVAFNNESVCEMCREQKDPDFPKK